ncbi:MAG: GerMN domain-containing protein [Rectinema sp.]
MASRKRKKKNSSNTGCLVLLIALVVLLIVFIAEYPNIKATFEKTKFLDVLKQRTEAPSAGEPTSPPSQKPSPSGPDAPNSVPSGSKPGEQTVVVPPSEQPHVQEPVAPFSPSTPKTAEPKTAEPTATQPTAAPTGATSPAQQGTQPPVQTQETRSVSLFFMKIEDDGTISSHEVKRTIAASDAPLNDAIKTLIAGPNEAEIRNKLVSLIPKGTVLRGVNMRGSTALIDLSDAFMYNKYGIEGYTAQLKQIVYTATAFPSVHDVQILIEGKTRDYLGGEGVYIGKPLSRNSF